jgi:hypothetical protein
MASTAGGSAHRQFGAARRARRRLVALWAALAATAAAAAVLLALASWHRGRVGAAMVVLVGGLLAAALCAAAARAASRSDPGRWERGAEGERRTAEILSSLPAGRWTVLHDLAVPASKANVDHLVIGPTGTWLVDTKTSRAEVSTRWRAVQLGSTILDPAPTAWEAEVVADRLGVPVRPLIALHAQRAGAPLPRRGKRIGAGVRVVSADDLLRRLRKGRRRLSGSDVDELARRAVAQLHPRLGGGGGAGIG